MSRRPNPTLLARRSRFIDCFNEHEVRCFVDPDFTGFIAYLSKHEVRYLVVDGSLGLNDRNAYRVIFERDDNNRWFVRCPDVQGAHSHGRTLAAARANIREAIALVLDLADHSSLDLIEEVRLADAVLQQLVDRARKLRDNAAEAEDEARLATMKAVEESTGSNASLSLRDLADLLGLSHQRVQQLLAETPQTA